MIDDLQKVPQRVEFRVICHYDNSTELTWKITDTLEDAIRYIQTIDPRLRDRCEWLVLKVMILETETIVHRVEKCEQITRA